MADFPQLSQLALKNKNPEGFMGCSGRVKQERPAPYSADTPCRIDANGSNMEKKNPTFVRSLPYGNIHLKDNAGKVTFENGKMVQRSTRYC